MSVAVNEPCVSEIAALASLINGDTDAFLSLAYSSGETSYTSINTLNYHGITALVVDRLSKQQHNFSNSETTGYFDQWLKKLAHIKPLMIANEALRANELTTLLGAFKQAGLNKHIVFKGTALAYTVYPEPWLRPRSDTDILIEHGSLDNYCTVFTELGYERSFAIDGDLISYQCSFGKRLVGNATLNIDVHWRINNRQCLAHTFSLDELLSRAQTIPLLDSEIKIPSTEDSILIACLHRLGHHHTEERLAWLYDIHLLTKNLDATSWAGFTELAMQKKLTKLCLDGLSNTQHYFHSNIPKATLETFNLTEVNQEPSAVFLNTQLSNWGILKSDLKAINSWVQKFAFITQTAFPSPEYIRRHMGTSSALLGYCKRSVKGLKRLIKQ